VVLSALPISFSVTGDKTGVSYVGSAGPGLDFNVARNAGIVGVLEIGGTILGSLPAGAVGRHRARFASVSRSRAECPLGPP